MNFQQQKQLTVCSLSIWMALLMWSKNQCALTFLDTR